MDVLLQDQVEMVRVTHINAYFADKLRSALDTVIETTQDFTDSAYTSHEHRERIVEITEHLQQAVHVLVKTGSLQVIQIITKMFSVSVHVDELSVTIVTATATVLSAKDCGSVVSSFK